jgi:hypothetical protein
MFVISSSSETPLTDWRRESAAVSSALPVCSARSVGSTRGSSYG